jgi:hypothetical protein
VRRMICMLFKRGGHKSKGYDTGVGLKNVVQLCLVGKRQTLDAIFIYVTVLCVYIYTRIFLFLSFGDYHCVICA